MKPFRFFARQSRFTIRYALHQTISKNVIRKAFWKTIPTLLSLSQQFSALVQNLRDHLKFSPQKCIRWLYPVWVHVLRDLVDLLQKVLIGTIITGKYKMNFQLKPHFTILDLEIKLLRCTPSNQALIRTHEVTRKQRAPFQSEQSMGSAQTATPATPARRFTIRTPAKSLFIP